MATELPGEIAAGLAAQLARRRAALDAGARRVGWKLAYGIAEIEALVGDAPAIGHRTSATLLEPGDRILAGSSCHVPAAPGDAIVAAIDGLGSVRAAIAG
jgi:hypothetical protein